MEYSSMSKEELIKEIDRLKFFQEFYSVLHHNISKGINEPKQGGDVQNDIQRHMFVAVKIFVEDCEKEVKGEELEGIGGILRCLNSI